MTPQEAVKVLSENGFKVEGIECDTTKLVEAILIAIEALEKQIPKKPIEEQSLMTCSICGCQEIESIDASGIRQYPYCPCCGNAQDWSDNQ